ncbi:MAG: 6-phospho-3-hexuloisomerase [Candidatus Syntropharchaeia archaeon]
MVVEACEKCIRIVMEHIEEMLEELDREKIKEVIDTILDAEHIFLTGAGRSGLVAKAFAMRLMHLGLNVYVVGETTTPAVKKNDLVIAISGSGSTISTANMGKIAKDIGAKLITITSIPDSVLGKLSDIVLVVKGRKENGGNDYFERRMRGEYKSLAPLGTIFEILTLILLDAIIAELMTITGKSEMDLKERHAVLE